MQNQADGGQQRPEATTLFGTEMMMTMMMIVNTPDWSATTPRERLQFHLKQILKTAQDSTPFKYVVVPIFYHDIQDIDDRCQYREIRWTIYRTTVHV